MTPAYLGLQGYLTVPGYREGFKDEVKPVLSVFM
jgi:hypothetical protein